MKNRRFAAMILAFTMVLAFSVTAMAEYLGGTEEGFVKMMNEKELRLWETMVEMGICTDEESRR